MKSNKLTVANGIMEESEYFEMNLADVDSVKAYADGIEVLITNEEAEEILAACTAMRARLESGEIPTQDEWYHDFEEPLSQTRGEKIAEAIRYESLGGANFVTYGDGDLGVAIPIFDAMVDFESMADDQIGNGTWHVCDETGKIIK